MSLWNLVFNFLQHYVVDWYCPIWVLSTPSRLFQSFCEQEKVTYIQFASLSKTVQGVLLTLLLNA